ncbi:MAG: glycosyltransferase involved in cell wall biosynthesis, partial [Phenylobacterium sp.]
MNDKTVSVVIPCLNVASTIEAAVASARQQQQVEVQIICIDDNSTD